MSFNFVKFEGRNTRFEDRITVTKSYSIGLPSKFYSDNNIDNFKYVVLYWDEDSRAIGLNFTNSEDEPSKFRIARTKGYGANISARSFFNSNNIDPKLYHGRYEWEKVTDPNVGEIFAIKIQPKKTASSGSPVPPNEASPLSDTQEEA